ncbi:HAMP domain-containing protein [Verminephrobacter aporrectodeae subsp. tuberculatae]|uniref:methyl-accepting chemotaxis protein n=1 Tax=Verminephrobacter aporrectodeae TaxID=1110389 RepID=UPI002243AF01|nr:methyl-accepting chemotaxis protein [Verminephrobacter aporrectodeae]MCW8199258.1 HAMP domain-containing protein [Verminephrobacter aporrectodeae subsp. tuberculatae]
MHTRFRMAHKLWLAVLLIVVLLVAVLGISGYRLVQVQAQADAVANDMTARVQAALRWSGLVEVNVARTRILIASPDPALEAQFKATMVATSAQITEVQKSLQTMALTDADKAQMAKIAEVRKVSVGLRDQALKLKSEDRSEQAQTVIEQSYNPAIDIYLQSLRDFVQQQQKNAQTRQQEMAAMRTLTLKIATVAVVLLLLTIVVGAYYLIGSIQRPLAQANGLVERIAGGDLSLQESVTRADEFGDLLRSLYAMSNALGRMVHQVRLSTDSIALASAEIAAGNQDLSQRTEQTSSDLQQTAATMEEFTSTIEQSASSAQQASSLAAGATGVARKGGEVVTQVVATMEDINHSSKKIADIIGVIDGIAFQTNILALNAAVEAARAGEQGRGFAVVASEVRSLAQRSAEAAKEIKQLISASVEKVETGSRLVSDAGTTMTDIVQSVQRVTDMIGEITAASSEQSTGVSQVNKAIGNLDQMTQQNAALVEQSAAAAQSLREQADHLAREVSMFKVNAASYGPAQAAIDAARVTSAMQSPPRPAKPAPGLAPKAAPRRLGTATAAPPGTKVARAPALSGKAGSGKPATVKQGSEEEWESF